MNSKITVFAVIFFLIGFLVLFEQYMNYGIWFEIEDIHHETFALSFIALAIGLLVGSSNKKNIPKN